MSKESKFDLSSWERTNDVGYDHLLMAYLTRSEEMPSDATRALKELARDRLADVDSEEIRGYAKEYRGSEYVQDFIEKMEL